MSNIWDKIYSDDSAFFGEDPLPVTNAILNNEFKIGVLLCYKFLLKPPVRTSNSKFAYNLNDITKNLQFI